MVENILTKSGALQPKMNKSACLNEENTQVKEIVLTPIFKLNKVHEFIQDAIIGHIMSFGGAIFYKARIPDYVKGDLALILTMMPSASGKSNKVRFQIEYNIWDPSLNEPIKPTGTKRMDNLSLKEIKHHPQNISIIISENEIGTKRNLSLKLIRISGPESSVPEMDPIILDAHLRYLAWAVPKPGTGEDIRNM